MAPSVQTDTLWLVSRWEQVLLRIEAANPRVHARALRALRAEGERDPTVGLLIRLGAAGFAGPRGVNGRWSEDERRELARIASRLPLSLRARALDLAGDRAAAFATHLLAVEALVPETTMFASDHLRRAAHLALDEGERREVAALAGRLARDPGVTENARGAYLAKAVLSSPALPPDCAADLLPLAVALAERAPAIVPRWELAIELARQAGDGASERASRERSSRWIPWWGAPHAVLVVRLEDARRLRHDRVAGILAGAGLEGPAVPGPDGSFIAASGDLPSQAREWCCLCPGAPNRGAFMRRSLGDERGDLSFVIPFGMREHIGLMSHVPIPDVAEESVEPDLLRFYVRLHELLSGANAVAPIRSAWFYDEPWVLFDHPDESRGFVIPEYLGRLRWPDSHVVPSARARLVQVPLHDGTSSLG